MTVVWRVFGTGATVALLLAGVLAASPAGAEEDDQQVAVTTDFVRPGGIDVSVRRSPSVSGDRKTTLIAGASIRIRCQLVGGRLGTSKYRDDRTWNLLVGGGYVHDMVTTTRKDGDREQLPDGGYVQWSDGLDRCPTPTQAPEPGALAADWAAAQVGLWEALPQDIIGFAETKWDPGPRGEWSGDSAKFVAAAWAHAGRTVKGDVVKKQVEAYRSRLKTGTPTRGAIVFYPDMSDKGQAAISAGDGTIYTTIGADDHDVPISRVDLDFFGQPAGWVLP